MYFCLRVDLDYVPWDSPDAKEFGHGEPAAFLRMLELAKSEGLKFHFFASNRNLLALPSIADAVLNEGHHLDWLCKHADQAQVRFAKALALFEPLGSSIAGFAYRSAWPADQPFPEAAQLSFLSALTGSVPPANLHLFPVDTKNARDSIRGGSTIKSWFDSVKIQVRENASRRRGVTVVVRPQVFAKHDPHLYYLKELLTLAEAVGLEIRTLRQQLAYEAKEAVHPKSDA
jgi:hypothetical protein